MTDKPYSEMDEAELRAELAVWEQNVETATGWSSAYFAAQQVKAICKWAERRGFEGFANNYPIIVVQGTGDQP